MDTVIKIIYILMLKYPGIKVERCFWDDLGERMVVEMVHPDRRRNRDDDDDVIGIKHTCYLETSPFYANTHSREVLKKSNILGTKEWIKNLKSYMK